MSSESKFVSKYWICFDCAKSKGWICTESAITVIHGCCSYCKDNVEKTMVPIVDFKRGNIEPIFD